MRRDWTTAENRREIYDAINWSIKQYGANWQLFGTPTKTISDLVRDYYSLLSAYQRMLEDAVKHMEINNDQ